MNVDPNLHFDAHSSSKILLDKYCTTFAGTSVSASALATVAALLSLSTATDHPPTPATGAVSSVPSVYSAASSGHSAQPLTLPSPKGSEPSPRTPPTAAGGNTERFHVYLCNGHEEHSGSDVSSSSQRSQTTDSGSSRRSLPSPTNTLPESWFNTNPSSRNGSCVYTFHYCVKSCGPSGAFSVYEAKIIPVSSNILLATAPLFVTQSRLTDITTFQAPTIGVFVRESTSHRRRQLSTTPYTPESIELYAEVLAELLRNSPFMSAVSPRTPPSSKPSTQRLDSSSSNTPEYRFAGHNGTSSSSSFGSAGGAPHRFGDADLRPHLGSGQVGADGVSEHPCADGEQANVPWE